VADVDLTKILEAILFAADSPVPLDRLTAIVGDAERGDVRQALKDLAERFDSEDRPYRLSEVAGGWQTYCRPEYSRWIKELHKGRIPTRLSQAALETLAIVAYKQPIVRAEIEAIRGVDSSGVLATLMRRDLITIAGRAPGMGRALMYRTTREFLRYFGLNFITDLPRLEEFAEVLGLKPGEMELAVEGAESVAEIRDEAAPEADTDGEDEPPRGDEEQEDGWSDADVPVPTEDRELACDREVMATIEAEEPGYERGAEDGGEEAPPPVDGEDEPPRGEGEEEPPVPSDVPTLDDTPETGDPHSVSDRRLIDESNET
jgi:segregation and condensation protein B